MCELFRVVVQHLLKPFLLPLTSFNWFIASWALAFLTTSWTVLLHSSQITCPSFHLQYTSFLCSSIARTSLLIHAGFLAFLLDCLLIGTDCSWSQKKWSLTCNQLPQISSVYFIKRNWMQQFNFLVLSFWNSPVIRKLLSELTHQLWYLECFSNKRLNKNQRMHTYVSPANVILQF